MYGSVYTISDVIVLCAVVYQFLENYDGLFWIFDGGGEIVWMRDLDGFDGLRDSLVAQIRHGGRKKVEWDKDLDDMAL